MHSYKNAIQDNQPTEANRIYEDKIKGDNAKELEVSEYLKTEIEQILQDYISHKSEYAQAVNQLENFQKTHLAESEAGAALSKVHYLPQFQNSIHYRARAAECQGFKRIP